jgi:hypothetical protein
MLLLCLILIATLVLTSNNDASGAPDTRLHLVEKVLPTRIADMLSLLSVISSACNDASGGPVVVVFKPSPVQSHRISRDLAYVHHVIVLCGPFSGYPSGDIPQESVVYT